MVVILVAALAASTAALAYLPTPFLWIALLWTGVLFVLAIRHKRAWLRVLWVNLAALLIVIGAGEFYFHTREAVRMEGSFTEGYKVEHEVLGYSPAAGRESRAIKYHGAELVYDVNYRIDRRGLRVSPPTLHSPACGSVLFFGGSLTFGEGVEDKQTMPYVTGIKTKGHYAIDNFGFHGYGPHQMLAALEQGVVDEVVDKPVSHVIYQGITAHVARSAGRARWDRHGPWYVLDSSGKPVYSGPFDGGRPRAVRWLLTQLDKSALYRWSGSLEQAATTAEIEHYVAIVAAAGDTVARKFPAAEFHVLLWGWPGEKTYDAMLDGLRGNGVRVHTINKILPAYTRNPAAYEISPFDRHPNPSAHEQIAGYVSTHILHNSSCQALDALTAGATR